MKRITKLAEVSREIWHNVLPLGEFYDPRYGKVKITKEMVEQMAENFKKRIPAYEPPVTLSHKDELGAYGRVEDLEARENGLWAKLVLTEEGYKLVKEGKFRYVSAEFTDSYIDKETGKDVGYVFLGVALTNRPAHPLVEPLQLADRIKEAIRTLVEYFSLREEDHMEKKEFAVPADPPDNWAKDEDSPWDWDWARDANEIIERFGWDTLAKACAYVDMDNYERGESGYPEVKTAYKLPFAKVKNGRMTIYKRGVIAAMQVLLGARGGVDIPRDEKPRVYEKLSRLYGRFDMEPPEFHYAEEVQNVQLEELQEKVKTLEEEKVKLLEENERLRKENEQLKREKLTLELEEWAKEWIRKGVKPVAVERAKAKLLEDPSARATFDEIFATFAQEGLTKQLSEEEKKVDPALEAKEVAKLIWGGEAK